MLTRQQRVSIRPLVDVVAVNVFDWSTSEPFALLSGMGAGSNDTVSVMSREPTAPAPV